MLQLSFSQKANIDPIGETYRVKPFETETIKLRFHFKLLIYHSNLPTSPAIPTKFGGWAKKGNDLDLSAIEREETLKRAALNAAGWKASQIAKRARRPTMNIVRLRFDWISWFNKLKSFLGLSSQPVDLKQHTQHLNVVYLRRIIN